MTHISSDFTCLVVEDDEPKLKAITLCLNENFPEMQIVSAKSLAKAVHFISKSKIDLGIIDMSLPAFDLDSDMTGGGQPQDYGGRDILRFIEDEKPEMRVIVLTQYGEFNSRDRGKQTLDELTKELHLEFKHLLLEVVFYSGQRGGWRERITNRIKDVMNND